MEGSNILGFFPGKFWNTAKDRPLIIGAHWDTVETTKGFNDNGSGVTVMLEISRILIRSKCFVPDFTIIFVAFDAEEEGAIGTQQLINSIVVPYYKRQGVDIQVGIMLIRFRPRFFDQVGHQTTNASIGNKYFFNK